ncbi:hypothetical protein, conserved [Babesia bigemina]|uniref:Uncharacterized protein n=1 Tax=Babesia bigemina TaxID=5866 RepID=A0A061BTL9_BABBI|nr:hypothetical protein, conserved [Babesia bigemina]CDR71839.1 hypothetical protein, conserved [Babesia bigemina]|eukprot:XP_012770782.1 hypothetical protein, conserved [Babesia bigemina]
MRRVRRGCGIPGSVGVGGPGWGDTGVRVKLRGLGAAVVEGTGSGSGTCCSWLRGLGGEKEDGLGRLKRPTHYYNTHTGRHFTVAASDRLHQIPTQQLSNRVSTQESATDTNSSPAPYIIVPVALIIVVICVMVYFRIRPFHRVRYLLRS